MRFYFFNSYTRKQVCTRCFAITPSLCISTSDSYSFDSIKISWLGFTIGLYR